MAVLLLFSVARADPFRLVLLTVVPRVAALRSLPVRLHLAPVAVCHLRVARRRTVLEGTCWLLLVLVMLAVAAASWSLLVRAAKLVAPLRLQAAKVARVAVAFRFQAAQVRRAQAAR